MTVEYRSSTVTNMDVDNSNVGYRQLLGDGSNLRYSVYALRNNPFRAATVVLGLLCALLMLGVIGQSVHYRKVEQGHQNNLKAASNEKEKVQENLKKVQNNVKTLETSLSQLEQSNKVLYTRKEQIQTNIRLLTENTNALQLSQSTLKASNTAFSKEIGELKADIDLLQNNSNAVSSAKELLEDRYDSVLKRKNEVQASFESVTNDKNNLQNKLNNVTRAREHLQLSYNDLIQKVEHLQVSYNVSNSEKEKIESSHQTLTMSKATLQDSCKLLSNAKDELQVSYASLVQEKEELESSCKNAIVERDQLKAKNDNLTAVQAELEKLKKIASAKKCPTGWTRSDYSCYFTSAGKSNWTLGRDYCRSKGADLAVVKSQEEMLFINGLYASDKKVWIGLTDGGIDGQWKWVDGTPMTTTFWGKDQPSSLGSFRNQDCVEFWHSAKGKGTWNNEMCNIEQQFICEM